MFSSGTGTFLHEMIELAGAENIFADQISWIAVTDEMLLQANPDVILTSTDFLDDPIAEIMGRPGFHAITAVQTGNVHRIDTASSSRPSPNLTRALREIAQAIFPEYFQ
jgi:iron complex transport system substrate-binding protein